MEANGVINWGIRFILNLRFQNFWPSENGNLNCYKTLIN